METHNFDDRPIIDINYDRLGFGKPAQALAGLLARTPAPEGFVAAVTGEWGEGKTTFLNFVTKSDSLSLTPEGLSKLEVIWFDPWLVSGHQDLVAAFFKHLADELNTAWDVAKNITKSTVGVAAEVGKSAVNNGLAKAAGKVALLADGGLLSNAASILANESLDKAIEALAAEPSLQNAYENLSKQLRSSNRRFLVVVDEIDRLSPNEIRTMINMVKSVGRLPNVTYLLSYDPKQVHRALGYENMSLGKAYTEKIVQHELSLPSPIAGGVLKLLDERVSGLLDGTEDDMRWYRYISSGLRRWIQKPRDAIRLSGAFNFIGEQLKGEVDLQDVIILEGLRLYQPEVYQWIRQNDNFLVGTRGIYLHDTDKKAIGENLASLIDEADRIETLKLVANLFPQISKWLPGNQSTAGTSHYIAKVRGYVQVESAYRAYFSAGLSEGSISRAKLDMLAGPNTTVEQFNNMFEALDANNASFPSQVTSIVEAVHFRVIDRAQEMSFGVLDGLGFHYAKIDLANEKAEILRSPYQHLVSTIRICLTTWGADRASKYLLHLLDSQAPLDFKALAVIVAARSLGHFPSSEQETALVTSEKFEIIKNIMLEQIECSAANGILAKCDDIWRPLQLWAKFDESNATKIWVHAEIIRNKSILYRIGRGLVSRSLGKNVVYTLEREPSSDYIDFIPLMDAVSSYKPDELNYDELKLFTAILEGGQGFLSDDEV